VLDGTYYVRVVSVGPGGAPGTTAYVFDVTTPSIGGTAIPAATYYVRIVAVNGAGVSAPSTEVMLVVR
jgi:hypothetical protein